VLVPRGGDLDDEGVFDTGLVAVSPHGRAFVEWWAFAAPRRERALDLVPGRFAHLALRDPGLQVACWNLGERGVERAQSGFRAGGRPLRTFHFSGFDPGQPWLLTARRGHEPSVLLSENRALAELCSLYAAKLRAQGLDDPSAGYGFERLPNGLRLDRRTRRLYREALDEPGEEPPSPFEAADAFLDWLNEPVGAGGVSRYLMALYEEIPLLARSFPNLADGDADRYLAWIDRIGAAQEGVARELVAISRGPEAPAASDLEPGVNVVGYLRAEVGTGEAARQLIGAVEAASTPFATVTHRAVAARQGRAFGDECGLAAARYDVNLICVNPDSFWDFRQSVGPSLFAGRYTIGWWWWEVERFPESFLPALELVDELWTGSAFTARCLAGATSKPVVHVPLPYLVREPPRRSREELDLPDGFLFLFAFDFGSVARRKNPIGLVEAFKRAFRPGEGPVLVLKSIRGDLRLDELEHLRSVAADRPDIRVVDGYLDPADMAALVAACDCYVSLHRSEGFGLTLAEAMAYGKPVIATAYGGNLDFMSRETSLLVGYRLVEVGEGAAPYPEDAEWAEPDLDEAARLMRYVVEHPEEARALGDRARSSIRRTNTPERAAAAIAARIAEIRAARVSAPPEHAPPSSLERLAAWVEQGPSLSWQAPSRFGPAGRAYRRLLQRVLRPYELRKREFETLAVETLKEQNHRLHELERERGQELERK
jgi:glycosyltransferase involved in cell wall biosynthesis